MEFLSCLLTAQEKKGNGCCMCFCHQESHIQGSKGKNVFPPQAVEFPYINHLNFSQLQVSYQENPIAHQRIHFSRSPEQTTL